MLVMKCNCGVEVYITAYKQYIKAYFVFELIIFKFRGDTHSTYAVLGEGG